MCTHIKCQVVCDFQVSGFCYNWLARNIYAEKNIREGAKDCKQKRNDITKKYDELLDRKEGNNANPAK